MRRVNWLQEVDQGQSAKTGAIGQGKTAVNFGSKPVGFMICPSDSHPTGGFPVSDCRLQNGVMCSGGAELNGFDGGFSVPAFASSASARQAVFPVAASLQTGSSTGFSYYVFFS